MTSFIEIPLAEREKLAKAQDEMFGEHIKEQRLREHCEAVSEWIPRVAMSYKAEKGEQ